MQLHSSSGYKFNLMSAEGDKIVIKKNHSIVFPIRRRACKSLLKNFYETLDFSHINIIYMVC